MVVKLAHASIRILGPDVRPEVWTEFFGVAPTVDHGARRAIWMLDSRVQSDWLTPHFEYLITALKLPRLDMPAKLKEHGVVADCFCLWINEKGDRVPDISEEHRRIFEASGITIEVDEYPQEVIVCQGGTCSTEWI